MKMFKNIEGWTRSYWTFDLNWYLKSVIFIVSNIINALMTQSCHLAKTHAAEIMSDAQWSKVCPRVLACLVSRKLIRVVLPFNMVSLGIPFGKDILFTVDITADKRAYCTFTVACNEEDNCSPAAFCSFDGDRKSHVCICMPGYVGE